MSPVSGLGDRSKLGARKEFLNRCEVAILHEVGASAADEAGRFREGSFASDRFGELIIVFDDLIQPQPPMKVSSGIPREVFQYELPDRRIGNSSGESIAHLTEGFVCGKVNVAHRVQQGLVRGRIGFRRNIDDDKLSYLIRILRGELHRDFTAHRMSQYRRVC